jgi:signal peptidase II
MVDLRVKAYGTAAAILALDRLTKWWIERHVTFLDDWRIIPGFFDIIHSQNRGVAFGLFNDSTSQWRTTLLIVGAAVAVVVVSALLWKPERLDTASRWGFALILGGAAGNVLDRILWDA